MRNVILAAAAALSLALPASAKSSTAEVQCADGTPGKAGRGACSHHGGVAKAPAGGAKSEAAKETREKPTLEPRGDNRPSSTAASAQRQPRTDAPEPSPRKSGGLGGIFGRRNTDDTPRSQTRQSPAAGKVPMATCKDGTTSYSAHHSGTCSGHGGVKEWLDK